jgi:uncharacterized protein YdeI (YjbR/CyaY-like superfamily)
MAKPKNVDEYLKRLEGNFAHPILTRVREIAHEVAPQLQEKIKWGAPSFEYKGLAFSMAAFKHFASVWFHKGALFSDPKNLLEASQDSTKSMRKYSVTSVDELDEEGLRGLILEAIEKNEKGEQVKDLGKTTNKIERSEMLEQALKENAKAQAVYRELSEAKKREYTHHIESAVQQATKQRRVKKALELLEQGLGLNDKYKK